ncbi:MAG: PAS domain S-box protein [Desulfobulbaceae bacterium]|nr:PAS domain S-box protein [Desulfobulbaceae bacterium]
MITFADLSIRKKLFLAIMATSSLAVLAACIAFYTLTINLYKEAYIKDIQSLTRVIAYNCQAALVFNIPEDAEKMLLALENRSSILAADIYDQEHKLFASYGNPAYPRAHPSEHSSRIFSELTPEGTMLFHEDIFMDGAKIGCITLIDNMHSIITFRNIALITLGVIVILVIFLSFLAAARIRDIISEPISELATISQEISENQDYSLRALKRGTDEVGHLVDTFNTMLEQISQRTDELRESEQRFRALVDQAVDSFFLHDMDGRIIDVNQRVCDTLGYSREELLSMTVEDIDTEADNDAYREQHWKKMPAGTPITFEGLHRRKDGSTFPVEVRAGLLELGDQKIIMALARDLSERIKAEKDKHLLESQLQQAQKMESIGTLAAGIAHDFNNILSPIYGYVELAQLKVRDNPELSEYLNEVRSAAHRAKDLVKQILTFSRQDSEKFSPVEVHVIIKEALKLLRSTIPSTIEIKQEIEPKCGYVLANPTQIHQVLMNLCTNAYHAMRESGGVLGVTLKQVSISAGDFVRNINLRPGPYLMLEVSDTGTGMNKETLARIFEPYFTTKAQGEGTGMGLSVVHGIIKSHGGNITVYSEPGRGSTFRVYLPIMEGAESKEEESPTGPLPSGAERILLVDDEKSVAKVEKDMLENLGYTVTISTSAPEALEHFRGQPDSYDLVITDMTMPKMTGDRLATEIMAIRPDIPVILCTGFSELINKEDALKIGIRRFVTKPIIITKFAKLLREVLDGEAVS